MKNRYPHSFLMKISAWGVVVAWILLAAIIVIFILGVFWVDINEEIFIKTLYVFALIGVSLIILNLFLKCPICGNRPTSQGLKAVHHSSKKIPGLDEWAVVIIDIVKNNEFRCIHCGSDFHL